MVGIGRDATRQLAGIVQEEKEYIAQLTLGQTSATDDAEGEKTTVAIKTIPDRDTVQSVLPTFVGRISQVPPAYSAIKVQGIRAYRAARKRKPLNLQPRTVTIEQIEILSFAWPLLTLRVVCGPGVYIRSLARDLGEVLQTGAFLSDLKRTRVGQFTIETALSLETLNRNWHHEHLAGSKKPSA